MLIRARPFAQNEYYESIVASMQAVQDGNFGGETLYGTLQNGALSAGELADLVPSDIQTKYLAYIDEMVAGTFMK